MQFNIVERAGVAVEKVEKKGNEKGTDNNDFSSSLDFFIHFSFLQNIKISSFLLLFYDILLYISSLYDVRLSLNLRFIYFWTLLGANENYDAQS